MRGKRGWARARNSQARRLGRTQATHVPKEEHDPEPNTEQHDDQPRPGQQAIGVILQYGSDVRKGMPLGAMRRAGCARSTLASIETSGMKSVGKAAHILRQGRCDRSILKSCRAMAAQPAVRWIGSSQVADMGVKAATLNAVNAMANTASAIAVERSPRCAGPQLALTLEEEPAVRRFVHRAKARSLKRAGRWRGHPEDSVYAIGKTRSASASFDSVPPFRVCQDGQLRALPSQSQPRCLAVGA